MTEGHSIELKGLTKVFEGRTVLDHATLRIDGPRAVGYLGPNGAGKTTTLKLLSGLLRPSDGEALVDGIRVADDPRAVLDRVGAVIETPEPYPTLTGRESLEMAGRFRGVPPILLGERLRALSEQLDLAPLDRPTGKLSKGQRQRVVIAATLLADPPVLLLDEPTSGLDPAERVRVRNVLRDLKKDHLILMSSHLLGEVTETCDDVVFLNQGKLVLKDSVRGIGERFRVRLVDVEFAGPVLREQLAGVAGIAEGIEALGDRKFRFSFDGSDATKARLLEACQKVAPVIGFSSAGSALEDGYLKLMDGGPASPSST